MQFLMRLAAILMPLILFTLMIGPFGGVEQASLVWDKAAHFIAFGLILWSVGVLFRRLPRLWAAALVLASGAAVEVIQSFVGRDADWGDLLADALGIATALLLWAIWRRFKPRAALQTSNTR